MAIAALILGIFNLVIWLKRKKNTLFLEPDGEGVKIVDKKGNTIIKL